MDHHEQLLQLASEYQIWAKTRKHKNSAVPKTIKNTIADLCKYFSKKQIAMAVGVSQTSIYYWSDIQAPRTEKTKTTTKAAFIVTFRMNSLHFHSFYVNKIIKLILSDSGACHICNKNPLRHKHLKYR